MELLLFVFVSGELRPHRFVQHLLVELLLQTARKRVWSGEFLNELVGFGRKTVKFDFIRLQNFQRFFQGGLHGRECFQIDIAQRCILHMWEGTRYGGNEGGGEVDSAALVKPAPAWEEVEHEVGEAFKGQIQSTFNALLGSFVEFL